MAESLPIVERIAQAIVAALEAVTADNGCRVTVTEVRRPTRTGFGFTLVNRGVNLVQTDAARQTELDCPGNPAGIAWRQTFAIDCVVRVGESASEPLDQTLNLFAAEIEAAVMADPTWGGLAIDTELTDRLYPPGEKGIEGVTVMFDVLYRVAEDDPFAQV